MDLDMDLEKKIADAEREGAVRGPDQVFWREKEKQLLDKEEQLREKEKQLRDKEEQLRDDLARKEIWYEQRLQELRVLPITPVRVYTLLDEFLKNLYKSDAIVPHEGEFTVDYPLCKVRLPKAPGDKYPRLLWHTLDKPHRASISIMKATKQAKPALTVLFNVSGAGKTRTLYEIAVAQSALFFVGVGSEPGHKEGSADLWAVQWKLAKLFPEDEGIINPIHAGVCLKALLISRFFLLRQLEQNGYVSGAAWLFKQVAFGLLSEVYRDADPFMVLTHKLLDLIKSPKDLDSAGDAFKVVLDELKGDWNGPIIFDECQVINEWLSNRFLSSKSTKESFLSFLVPCLMNFGFSKFFYAGTGGSMLTVARNISATLKQTATVMVFHGFGGFYSAEDLKAYSSELFFRVDSMDFPRLIELYKGRHRFFVTALERFIAGKQPMESATDFFVSFFEKFCTTDNLGSSMTATRGLNEAPLYMDRTVLADVQDFVSRSRSAGAVKDLELIFYHEVFGSLTTLINMNDPGLLLLEYNLGWLSDESAIELRNIDEFSLGRKERWLKLEEPAVIRALQHHFLNNPDSHAKFSRDMFMVKGQGDTSKIGLEFEKQAAFGAADALDGKAPVEFVRRFLEDGNKILLRNLVYEIPPIYFETASVVRPRSGVTTTASICTDRHTHKSVCFTLESFIRKVELEVDIFPTILLTGKALWPGFKPDAVLFLSNLFEGRRRLIPCVIQFRTKKDSGTQAGIRDALETTNLLSLRGKTDDNGLQRLIELAVTNGMLRLAVIPHKRSDMDQACFNVFKSELPSGGRLSPLKKQKTEDVMQPLCGVIGGHDGGAMFLKEWLTDLVWSLKRGVE